MLHGEGREDAAADSEVGCAHVRTFLRSVEAQRHLTKVFRIHQVTLAHRSLRRTPEFSRPDQNPEFAGAVILVSLCEKSPRDRSSVESRYLVTAYTVRVPEAIVGSECKSHGRANTPL